MKKILLWLCALCLISACQEDVFIFEPGPMDFGKVTGKKWTASPYPFQADPPNNHLFGFTAYTFEQDVYLR